MKAAVAQIGSVLFDTAATMTHVGKACVEANLDVAGHYSRPDIFSFNRRMEP